MEELKLLFRNKYWVLMLVAMLFVNISYGLSASVNTAIFTFSIYIPLALFIIMGIMFKKYDLEKIYPQIVEELRARRSEKGADAE